MQGSKPCFRCGTAFCRHRKSGLPSNPPNHKSDGGSLQSWNRPSPQLPATGEMNDGSFRVRRKRQQVIATNFAGVSPWRGKRLREENGRDCPAPALYEQTSWSGFPGLWFKKVLLVTMASSAIMERSASNRAIMAAGGTAMALRQRPADIQLPGTHVHPHSQRRALPRKLRLTAAGGKRNNAQQDADRRLPPGGNTRCRRSR
jgi:hypothetical protein